MYKLTIELVPKTAWYSNVRSNVTIKKWDTIRKKCYFLADNKCEICGDIGTNQGTKHKVECHEIWEYNDETKEQTLKGLISLCPWCHKTKHVGLAIMKGEEEIVVKQLIKVNNMTDQQARDYIETSFEQWQERNKHQWKLNIEMLEDYVK